MYRKKDNAETPNAETPNAETPNAETPNAETPNAETPNAETPNAETPNAETPNAETKEDFTLETLKTELAKAKEALVKTDPESESYESARQVFVTAKKAVENYALQRGHIDAITIAFNELKVMQDVSINIVLGKCSKDLETLQRLSQLLNSVVQTQCRVLNLKFRISGKADNRFLEFIGVGGRGRGRVGMKATKAGDSAKAIFSGDPVPDDYDFPKSAYGELLRYYKKHPKANLVGNQQATLDALKTLPTIKGLTGKQAKERGLKLWYLLGTVETRKAILESATSQ